LVLIFLVDFIIFNIDLGRLLVLWNLSLCIHFFQVIIFWKSLFLIWTLKHACQFLLKLLYLFIFLICWIFFIFLQILNIFTLISFLLHLADILVLINWRFLLFLEKRSWWSFFWRLKFPKFYVQLLTFSVYFFIFIKQSVWKSVILKTKCLLSLW
jgi:hypothetical protein